MIKKIFIIVGVLALLTGIYGYYLYNKPVNDIKDENPFVTITAQELFHKFELDQAAASASLSNKVIQVNGSVSSIEQGTESVIILLNERIKCEVQSVDKDKINIDSQIIIKGIYSGFDEMFNEISLVRCFIIE